MSSKSPPAPQGGGNAKYIAVLAVLGVALVALYFWKNSQKTIEPDHAAMAPATVAPAPPPPPPPHHEEELPPPPAPEVPDAAPPTTGTPRVATGPAAPGPCDVKVCSGRVTDDLQVALRARAKAAHRCYDQALNQDSTLKGNVSLNVKVAFNGDVCAVGIGSNDMGTPQVAQCVANMFRSSHFPAPIGGCIEANVPINFVPTGAH